MPVSTVTCVSYETLAIWLANVGCQERGERIKYTGSNSTLRHAIVKSTAAYDETSGETMLYVAGSTA